MVLIIDNYDSFVYNLARYCHELGFKTKVVRNNKISINNIKTLNPSHIILSPGPFAPQQAGICCKLVEAFAGIIPILGVCLGHQVIGQVFGGKIERAIEPMHGKKAKISHNGSNIFKNAPNPLTVGRYHSLIISPNQLPNCLQVTAYSKFGEIMAIQHKKLPIFGVQFHPESVLSEFGYELLANFIN